MNLTEDNLFLYNVTLQEPTAFHIAVLGHFTGGKNPEILAAKGEGFLELFRLDLKSGAMISMLSTNVFGIVRSVMPFRLTGSSKDYAIIGSDSGRIVILEYDVDKNEFKKIHQETFGRSGVRRIVPGEYLAVDPNGRAAMIASMEKQKIVYVLNRDTANNLTISSPLEAHRGHTVVFACIGLDMGFENPIFACIEASYQDSDGASAKANEKSLTYYELDLGLNHVSKKWTTPLPATSHHLIQVPGGEEGPGGTIVCSEGRITWMHQDCEAVSCRLPFREGLATAPRLPMVACSSVLQLRKQLLVWLQTEDGDLHSVILEMPEDKSKISSIKVRYMDTVPCGVSVCLHRRGFLFVAAEGGNHQVYQIQSEGGEGDVVETASGNEENVLFRPRDLQNIFLVDELNNLGPMTGLTATTFPQQNTPSLLTLCGRGPRSSLRCLQPGIQITEIASSPLPGTPNAVFGAKKTADDPYHSYFVVSFPDCTMVLSIGETVEEVNDSGFRTNVPTLATFSLGSHLVQVHPAGIRLINTSVTGQHMEWAAPTSRPITSCAHNSKQVAIGLTGGELVYFELIGNDLKECDERKRFPCEICSMDMGEVEAGRVRFPYLVVGCVDCTVHILSLDADSCLTVLAQQALQGCPHSLLLEDVNGSGEYTLYIGLDSGIMQRTRMNFVNGTLADTRKNFLGIKPIKLFRHKVGGSRAVLALTDRPWIFMVKDGRSSLKPFSHTQLDSVTGFNWEKCPEGFVGTSGQMMLVMSLDNVTTTFSQKVLPLAHTPRKMAVHPKSGVMYIVESDPQSYCPSERANLPSHEPSVATRAGPGKWASCIRIVDPSMEALFVINLDENEAVFSLCLCQFEDKGDAWYLVVGSAKTVHCAPKYHEGAFIWVYKLSPDGRMLESLHKTEVEDIPTALAGFNGHLLAGVGNVLRLYKLGKKRFLKKSENRTLIPNMIVGLHVDGDRIIVSDLQDSIRLLLFNENRKQFVAVIDDNVPRWVSCLTKLDRETYALADKFGNLCIHRIEADLAKELLEDPDGTRFVTEQPFLQGAPNRFTHLANFSAGATITGMEKTCLVPGGREVLVYGTVMGAIGVMIPVVSREEVDFLQHVEMHMRSEAPPLCGRIHLAYRSHYQPVKNVIDGDLCEQFYRLPSERKDTIARELDRTVSEVTKKLEDVRAKMAIM